MQSERSIVVSCFVGDLSSEPRWKLNVMHVRSFDLAKDKAGETASKDIYLVKVALVTDMMAYLLYDVPKGEAQHVLGVVERYRIFIFVAFRTMVSKFQRQKRPPIIPDTYPDGPLDRGCDIELANPDLSVDLASPSIVLDQKLPFDFFGHEVK